VTNRQLAAFVEATGDVTEAEWEMAARGGLDQARYAWATS
jgi:formylglycine-generating enzyme required for sulfatase activity